MGVGHDPIAGRAGCGEAVGQDHQPHDRRTGEQASDLQPWLQGAIINRDRNLRLQFLAGMSVNNYTQAAIYSQMLLYRRFPENLIKGSEATLEPLRRKIRPPSEQDADP